MAKYFFILILSLGFFDFASAQKKISKIDITISDNNGFQFLSQDYRITHDSLFITGVSDNGKTKVDYLKRMLTKSEKKQIQLFFTKFSCDSLQKEYFNEFNSMGYITYDHYPRVINMTLKKNDNYCETKITNCFVFRVSNMINYLNDFFPAEVKIFFKKEDFKEAY